MQRCIFRPFLEWVRKEPALLAVTDEKETWSYNDLYRKAIQIALSLESYKKSKISRIIVLGSKSNESIAAILGILFTNSTYCPLDINLPFGRLDKIFSILSPSGLILTGLTPFLKYSLKNLKIKPKFILDLGNDLPTDILEDVERINLEKGDYSIQEAFENPAYIIFTSGSTGTPKGVSMSHSAADSALNMFQDHVGIQKTDRICNQVALCFDLSIFDIFGSLRQGASIHLIPPASSAVPNRFTQWLINSSITSFFTVPSTVSYLIENSRINLKGAMLKNLLFSGEPLTCSLLEKITEFFPNDINIWNLYGATEIPYVLAEKIVDTKNPNFFSLKGKEIEVRLDTSSELLVKSPAVLSGYQVEGSTSLSSPLKEDGWYPTGDRAVIGASGNITLLGRIDRQIKIQGHRVELDEIEHQLETYEEVQEAAVIFLEEQKKLVAFIVLSEDFQEKKGISFLEERCKASLPIIMCPQHYYLVPSLPRTASGKKNRKALLEIRFSHDQS